MSVANLLHIRRTEQEDLLQRATTLLQADQRVVAAWLFGSRGRHTADALSDTDLWVVVTDEQCESIVAERQEYVAQLGQPVLVLESPGNAPAKGGYLMALYPGQVGVQQIDWYWQRQSDASLPQQATVLFDRVGITKDTRQEQLDQPDTSEPLSQHERATQVTQLCSFFWVMSNIAVKSILRHKAWEAVSHLEGLRGLVDEVRLLLNLNTNKSAEEAWRTTVLPPVYRHTQITMLREIAREMEKLTSNIEAIGGSVQQKAIPHVYAFFELADAIIQQEEADSAQAERQI
jgi:predicted nucleotidyltransferase